MADGCWIEGTYWRANDVRPGYSWQFCLPGTATDRWTSVAAINSFVAVPMDGKVALRWDTSEATYRVQVWRGNVEVQDCASPAVRVYSGTGSAYVNTGLTNGTTYHYRLCTYDGSYNQQDTATTQATPGAGYTVGGTVGGLRKPGLVLRTNDADDLAIHGNGRFVFPGTLPANSAYDVAVLSNPADQTCSVRFGTGVVDVGSVYNVFVSCSDDYFAYVLNAGSDSISQFRINEDGTLTALVPATTEIPDAALALANGHSYFLRHPNNPILLVNESHGGPNTFGMEFLWADESGLLTTVNRVAREDPFAPGYYLPTIDPWGGFLRFIGPGANANRNQCYWPLTNGGRDLGTGVITDQVVHYWLQSPTVHPSGLALYEMAAGPVLYAWKLDFVTGAHTSEITMSIPWATEPAGVFDPVHARFIYYPWRGGSNSSALLFVTIDPVTYMPSASATLPGVDVRRVHVAIEPRGRFVYSGIQTGTATALHHGEAAADGTVTPLGSVAVCNGSGTINSLVVHPTGQFLYVVCLEAGWIESFALNPDTGAPTALAGSPSPTGLNPGTLHIINR
jgi:hypothetical protein